MVVASVRRPAAAVNLNSTMSPDSGLKILNVIACIQKSQPERKPPRLAHVNSVSDIAPTQGTRMRKNFAAFVGLTWKGDPAPASGAHGPITLVALISVP